MKPIETAYAGSLFRSRLEARWTVFFDTLGIEWQYEPQGFELPSGRYYLPDFWLPDSRAWFEVKGPRPTADEKETLVEFARGLATARPTSCDELAQASYLKVAVGEIPRPKDRLRRWIDSDANHEPETWDEGYIWRVLALQNGNVSVLPREWVRCDYGHTWVGWGWCWRCMLCDSRDDYMEAAYKPHPDVVAALTAARQARFEHGQTPRMPGDA